ncbi:MAG TPA: hypothetical protein DEP72_05980 [Clostridiales bacterium]|nr:MAG: hypothetical protein A2Y18_01395 [Clostridiales bacterium GWD2_32_19]HCC07687.1 hypothetical protein [Clostridiales bacterium]
MKVQKMNDRSSLEEMRAERVNANAVFIKFTSDNKYHETHAFCFYEGEDGKYYDPRIRNIFENQFITYIAGNKKEVLKLLGMIKNEDIYKDICKMFFVDRDYDDMLRGTDENLYETPCYSIENLYVQRECFIRILQSEFVLNITDEDFTRCVSDFEKQFADFNKEMLEFNALVLIRRRKSTSNSDVKFGDIKTRDLVDIKVTNVRRSAKYNETINNIKEKLAIDADELKVVEGELNSRNNFLNEYRGKNQLDFMVGFINHLKELNKESSYFSNKLPCVNINITKNSLSELSQYAIVPNCLNIFLEEHYRKMRHRLKDDSKDGPKISHLN